MLVNLLAAASILSCTIVILFFSTEYRIASINYLLILAAWYSVPSNKIIILIHCNVLEYASKFTSITHACTSMSK